MLTTPRVAAVVGCCLLGITPFTAVMAQDADEATAERCVSLTRIDRTDVIDDYNILFYMRNGDVYVNHLPHRCPGLRRERSFMYRTSLSQLCDLDVITVLDNAGFGFRQGPSCGLGRFYPVTEEEARILKESPPQRIEEKEVPTAEPEELEDDD